VAGCSTQQVVSSSDQGRSARDFLGGMPLGPSFAFLISSNIRMLCEEESSRWGHAHTHTRWRLRGENASYCVLCVFPNSQFEYSWLLPQHHVQELIVMDGTYIIQSCILYTEVPFTHKYTISRPELFLSTSAIIFLSSKWVLAWPSFSIIRFNSIMSGGSEGEMDDVDSLNRYKRSS